MRDAGSFALEELARTIAPAPEANTAVSYDVGTVTALDPFTVAVRGVSVVHAPRLHSYQRAKVNDRVFVLLVGATAVVLGPQWASDDVAYLTDVALPVPVPPDPPPDPPPPQTLVVGQYAATWAGSFRSNAPYNPGGHLRYGFDVAAREHFYSAWLYDTARIRADVAGRPIHAAHVHLHNRYTYRGTGTQAVVIHRHSAQAPPGAWDQVAGRVPSAIWMFPVPPADQAGWIDVGLNLDLSTLGGHCIDQGGGQEFTTFGWMYGTASAPPDPPIFQIQYWV
jgi:hypothetical protein